MEDSLDHESHILDRDSLSSDSFSKDSLLNGHENKEMYLNIKTSEKAKEGLTLKGSSETNVKVRTRHLTQPIPASTESRRLSYVSQIPSIMTKSQKSDMTQSMYERPWLTSTNSNAISSANAKQREEKLRIAKEEEERKHNKKVAVLNESEKLAQNARRRKELDSQKKMEEKKRKDLDRRRIVEERRQRLSKAEEERRNTILKRLVSTSEKKSSTAPNEAMTMSCYGGFGSARSKPGNKEVVHERVSTVQSRPPSVIGGTRVVAFGSSSPRPICEGTLKLSTEHKKIPEAILIKCAILSRPSTARNSDRMIASVYVPESQSAGPKRPMRQGSLKEKDTGLHSTMTESVSRTKSKIPQTKEPLIKCDILIKENRFKKEGRKIKVANVKTNDVQNSRTFSDLSLASKSSEEKVPTKRSTKVRSGTLPRTTNRKKVDTHLDSDSIEEEVLMVPRSNQLTKSEEKDPFTLSTDTSDIPGTNETNIQTKSGRALPTKDVSEAEYKSRLMENRRLVREKREREREQLIRSEREKRHAEELAARGSIDLDRGRDLSAEETHFTTSNDDTIDGPFHERGSRNDIEENQLSEIAETPSITCNDESSIITINTEEKKERKKKIDQIMSRVRRTTEESSSDGGVSPRRAMSPEMVELDPEVNSTASIPAFRSSLLQSMMQKGRLSSTVSITKELSENPPKQDIFINVGLGQGGAVLSSVRESIEDSESQITTRNSPSSVAIRSSGIEGNSLSDANSEFIAEPVFDPLNEKSKGDCTLTFGPPDIDREDCDGKEDSLSLNEFVKESDCQTGLGLHLLEKSTRCSTSSLTEEDIIKTDFEIDLIVFSSDNIVPVIQESAILQP